MPNDKRVYWDNSHVALDINASPSPDAISVLPEEILLAIFSNIQLLTNRRPNLAGDDIWSPSDISNATLTCRRFHRQVHPILAGAFESCAIVSMHRKLAAVDVAELLAYEPCCGSQCWEPTFISSSSIWWTITSGKRRPRRAVVKRRDLRNWTTTDFPGGG